jgi:hypothetical protein
MARASLPPPPPEPPRPFPDQALPDAGPGAGLAIAQPRIDDERADALDDVGRIRADASGAEGDGRERIGRSAEPRMPHEAPGRQLVCFYS